MCVVRVLSKKSKFDTIGWHYINIRNLTKNKVYSVLIDKYSTNNVLQKGKVNMNEFDYLAKAKNKMEDEKYSEVIPLCDKALDINKNLPKAYDFRGNAKFKLGQYDEALFDYTETIIREPNVADHYYDRSWVYCKMEKYEDAIIDINEAIKIEPKTSLYYFEKGRFEHWSGRHKEAIVDLTKAIELKPTENKYLIRGNCYVELDEDLLALYDYNSAIKIDPEFAKAYYYRGILYKSNEQILEAEKDLLKAIELNPEYDEAMLELGFMYIHLGKKEAMKYFNKAIKVNPSISNYYCRVIARSDILRRQDTIEKFAFGQYVKDDGDDIPIFNEKQARDDIKDLNKAFALDPDNTANLYLRVRRYNYLKQYENALSDYETLLELEPENKEWHSAIGYCKFYTKKYKESIENFDTYLKMNNGIGDYFLYLKKGCANYELQEFKNAVNDFTKGLLMKKTAELYYQRGLANCKLKHFIQSYMDFKKALKLEPKIETEAEYKIPKIIKLFLNKNKDNSELIGLNALKNNKGEIDE